MSSFDAGQQIKTVTLIPAQAWDGDADLTTATGISVAGAEGVAVVVTTGTVAADADHVIEFYEGDADDFTAAAATKLDDSQVIASPEIDATDNATYVYSIKMNKEFLKVKLSSATDKAAALAVTAVMTHLSNVPA